MENPIIYNSVFLYIKYNYIINIIIYWKIGNIDASHNK